MTFPTNQNLYGIGLSSTMGQGPQYVHIDVRAPTTTDVGFPLGQQWLWPANGVWFLITLSSVGGTLSATWVEGVSAGGDVLSVTGTANQITSSTTAGAVTLSLPAAITAPGSLTTTTSLTSGTSITATLGNITATNGNLSLATIGNKLLIATGLNASTGVSGNMSGSPGSIIVATTACTAASVILFSRATTGGTPGQVSISAQSTAGFTLLSTGNETSTFNWLIIN